MDILCVRCLGDSRGHGLFCSSTEEMTHLDDILEFRLVLQSRSTSARKFWRFYSVRTLSFQMIVEKIQCSLLSVFCSFRSAL